VQRLFFVIILAIVLIALPLSISSDTPTSGDDADIPNDEVNSRISKASNSSASATITMTGVLDD
jgi:hypothetical protein